MNNYPYDHAHFSPPAPAIKIAVSNKYRNKEQKDINALIDSGADGSLIPKQLVKTLELQPLDFVQTLDFEDKSHGSKPVYLIDLRFDIFSFSDVEAAEVDDDEFVIGRDILNQIKLHLDGKGLRFTLEDP